MAEKNKIGILGGTFNPIHYGHLRIAEEVREKLGLAKILFIPSCNPPLKGEDLADVRNRYEMTRFSVENNPFFDISDIECKRGGKSYTVETLASLGKAHPENDFYFIMGIDSFLEIPSWYQPEKLIELTHFVVVSRPGFRFSDLFSRIPVNKKTLSDLDRRTLGVYGTTMKSGKEIFLLNVTPIGISATAIRTLLRSGMSIKYLLPEAAESYIIANKLYQEGSGYL